MSEWIKSLTAAYSEVVEGKKKGKPELDKVDDDELDGDHDDRKDKDIDNDGDVDNSDKFLHKKRKAIKKSKDDEVNEVSSNTLKKYVKKARVSRDELDSKSQAQVPVDYGYDKENKPKFKKKSQKRAGAIIKARDKIKARERSVKEDEVEMNPKKKVNKTADATVVENTHPVYARIMEKRSEHYKKATAVQAHDDNWSPGAKQMAKDEGEVVNTVHKGHKDVSDAGRKGPKAKPRHGDNKAGDKSIVNKVKDTSGK